jgi:hypothetical protein
LADEFLTGAKEAGTMTEHPWGRLRSLRFPEDYPSREASQVLIDEMLFQRACQVVLWSLPAISMWAMKKGSEAVFGTGSNLLVVWKDRLNANTVISTPNSDVIYALGYIDLAADGPTVVEVPPRQQGILDDFWQRPITDVGFVGPDKGEGGPYLLLPPGYSGDVPDGYHTFTSRTNNVFVFWRAFIHQGDTATPVDLIERTRIYALADRAAPPEMTFPNGSARAADMVFPQDYRYFEMLAEFVDAEHVAPEDMAMRGMMASLGIVKGTPFAPDDHLRDILSAGAEVAVKMAKATRFGDHLPGTRYYDDRQWHNVLNVLDVEFNEDTFLNLDARVGMFVIGYSISPAMVMNVVGKGSKYPFAYRDVDGNYLSGGRSYRLHLPADVPAANFWSVTLYDAANASGLDNGQPFPSMGSLDDLLYNDDGSVDLYFGPEVPTEAPASNWLRTVPGTGWFTLLRLYSPTEAFFDQSWRPGDFQPLT